MEENNKEEWTPQMREFLEKWELDEICANRDKPLSENRFQMQPPALVMNLHKKLQRKEYMKKWREKMKAEHPIVWWQVVLSDGRKLCPRGRVAWQAKANLWRGFYYYLTDRADRPEIVSIKKIGPDLRAQLD